MGCPYTVAALILCCPPALACCQGPAPVIQRLCQKQDLPPSLRKQQVLARPGHKCWRAFWLCTRPSHPHQCLAPGALRMTAQARQTALSVMLRAVLAFLCSNLAVAKQSLPGTSTSWPPHRESYEGIYRSGHKSPMAVCRCVHARSCHGLTSRPEKGLLNGSGLLPVSLQPAGSLRICKRSLLQLLPCPI